MPKMEVRIVSKGVVKPSSPETIETKPPHKLCLFDQLTPFTFSPVIHFYTYNDHQHTTTSIIHHLKRSLSETLNIYYPFSGRTLTHPSNLFIHNFNKGLPFTQAQVNSSLTHFLKLHRNTELLNLFLPRQPYQREEPELQEYPVMELQVSVFSCGGIALGWTSCHKLVDGSTLDSFLASFSAFSRGSPNDVVSPNFSLAAELFPPRNSLPRNYLKLIESFWFTEADYVTKRFVFGPSSISRIRSMVPIKLSRVKALSCFIWQRAMAASLIVSAAAGGGGGAERMPILVEAVNLRNATKPPLPEGSVGNVLWWATAAGSPEMEMPELGNMVNDAVGAYLSDDYMESIQGESGYDTVSDYFEQLEALLSQEGEVDIVSFSSWTGFGFTGLDFGWGKPVWVGVMGKVGRAFRNLTVLMDLKDGRGEIEAWVTLDEGRMKVLERDPYFLEFAAPNPRISNL